MARFAVSMGRIGAWIAEALFPRFCVSCSKEGGVLCSACHAKWRPHPLVSEDHFAFFSYADPVARGLLQAWKYGFDTQAWDVLWREMEARAPFLQAWCAARYVEAFVPIPLFYTRHNERGFDQAQDIAERCAALVGIPCKQRLRRVRATAPQAKKTDQERLDSYKENPFIEVGEGACRVVLVDDVYTSGATVRAAQRALGQEVVGCLTLASGR